MSIISVVYVPEGIAMSADSRLTGYRENENGLTDRFAISDNSQKLFLINKSNVGIASCGDALVDGKTIADFLRVFEIEQIKDDDTIHTISEKLMERCNTASVSSYTSFLVCGYCRDEAFVYTVRKGYIKLLRTGTNYGANWDGETEAVEKLLLGEKRTQFGWNLMPLKDGIDLAEFLVDVTIKYQRFQDGIDTCGGPIDVLVITKDLAKFIKHKVLKP